MAVAATLFGEFASRVVWAHQSQLTEVLQGPSARGVLVAVTGETIRNRLRIAAEGNPAIALAVEVVERVWSTAIEQLPAKKVA